MTHGVAILSMVVLHLFCRTGAQVYGTPLIWVNDTTPLVYYFGFFAEICVPLYTICAGYARQIQVNKAGGVFSTFRKIEKLMVNYWIILVLFCVLALILPSDGTMPGSWRDFMESTILLHSYNGAWWYLKTYIILLLLPLRLLLAPVNRLKPWMTLALIAVIQIGWYLLKRYCTITVTGTVTGRVWTEISNLIHVLPYYWGGALLCKVNIFEKISVMLKDVKYPQLLIGTTFILLFVGSCIIHKAVLMPWVGAVFFLLFNLWQKGTATASIFRFLGKHSTNIWLTHIFFYLCVFPGLVQKAQYPILMLAFILALTIATSYVIFGIQKTVGFLYMTIFRGKLCRS